MEKLIIDRIEDGVAVIEKEDLSRVSVDVSEFDFSVGEGDVLLFDGEKYIKDEAEKINRKRNLLLMQEKLKEKSKNK